ncbi:NDR1/HIN1-like protein 10 [Zingiber officinale]|uniref:NDR1/HIN1-like protein 10 n=1 Tax=Zingiber officinale TaxID=94328 RepID=UPI001C4DAF9F|nr:NDR1/HIN1-like protein 10 [Zingiber officinale]
MAVFIALVFLAVVIIIPVLFLVPRMPEFAVSSACVTGFNLSSAQQQQLSASFDLNLTVHSPNRLKRIYYERVTASVVYASDILSENTLAPFDQGKGETTVLRVRLASLGEYVNSDVARGIESDRGRGDGAKYHASIVCATLSGILKIVVKIDSDGKMLVYSLELHYKK